MGVAETHFRTLVRNADDAIVHAAAELVGYVTGHQVGQEACPQLGGYDAGLGVHNPAVNRTDDVRVLVGGKYIVHLTDVHVLGGSHRQRGIGKVSAGIKQGFVLAVYNQELVRLNAFTSDQGIKHQTLVVPVVEQNNRLSCH